MMSRTHLAVGLATSLAIIRPTTFNECAVAVIGGTVGGVLADNDILDNDYQSDALIGQLMALGSTILAFILDCFLGFGISQTIIDQPTLLIIGGFAFLIFYIIGFFSNHRTFTHSFLAMILYTIAVALIYFPISIALISAYFSHLFLDVLNKKKVPIFYPLDFGICLKLCYANKTANKVFMYIGFVISSILLIIGIVLSFLSL